LDYGCGYGALLAYLTKQGFLLTAYTGFDVSETMLKNAREIYEHIPNHYFISQPDLLAPVDYVIFGSIFNVKLDADPDAWQTHIFKTLDQAWNLAKKGMAFNILTTYSSAEKMRPDLYYANPCFFFDYCKRNYSRDIALLHDYGVYEFTMLVRR
jgi:SAM-dependent methyltransferase